MRGTRKYDLPCLSTMDTHEKACVAKMNHLCGIKCTEGFLDCNEDWWPSCSGELGSKAGVVSPPDLAFSWALHAYINRGDFL
jgi:hypothetical protein